MTTTSRIEDLRRRVDIAGIHEYGRTTAPTAAGSKAVAVVEGWLPAIVADRAARG